MQPNFALRTRAAGLESHLWAAIHGSGERNVSVIISALAALIKRASEYNIDAEADETTSDRTER